MPRLYDARRSLRDEHLRNYLMVFKWRLLLLTSIVYMVFCTAAFLNSLSHRGWEASWLLGIFVFVFLGSFFLFFISPKTQAGAVYLFLFSITGAILYTVFSEFQSVFFLIAPVFLPLIIFLALGLRKGTVAVGIFLITYAAGILLKNYFSSGVFMIPRDSLYILSTIMFSIFFGFISEYRTGAVNQLLLDKIYYDNRTGIPNRNMLIEKLDEEGSLAHYLGICTLNDFKGISIFFGYRVGDLMLQFISERLQTYKSSYQFSPFMLGNGEFAVLYSFDRIVPKETEMEGEIQSLLQFIKSDSFVYQSHELKPIMTFGISHSTQEGHNSRLLSEADSALKTAGLNRQEYHFYIRRFSQDHLFLLNLDRLSILTSALEDGRIIPFFQPVIDNSSGKIRKFESLARMILPDGQVQAPHYFLEIARQSKQYQQLSHEILRQSFIKMQDQQYDFSINVSQEDINGGEYLSILRECLAQYPKVKDRVILELLETEKFENSTSIDSFIYEAKKLGCKIAIDDFGTGYSNFSRILKWKIDILKLDGSLIRSIDSDHNSLLLVDSIVSFSKKLGIETVAEYVHSERVHDTVKNLGIDYSQGYFFGKPQQDISDFIQNRGNMVVL